jgi:hypothetical protein
VEKFMKTLFSTLLITLIFLTGPGIAGEDSSQNVGAVTACEDPRPQVCTMDYRPVCGNLADGSVKTYSNGCGACSDANVSSWIEGECPR